VAGWFGRPAHLSFQPWESWAAGWDPPDAQATWEHVSRSPSASIDKAVATLAYRPRYTSLEAVFEALTWLVAEGQVDSAGRKLAFS
jgi:nucleoside-diphosphate-sugar epimerase